MSTVTVQLDPAVLTTLRKTRDEVAQEMLLAAAIRWYDQGLLSQGRAAQVAGMSRSAFLDALGSAGVAAIQDPLDDVRKVLAGA